MTGGSPADFDAALAAVQAYLSCVMAPGVAGVDDLRTLKASADEICRIARVINLPDLLEDREDVPPFAEPDFSVLEDRFATLGELAMPGVDPWVDIHHPACDFCRVEAFNDAGRALEAEWEFKFRFTTHRGMHLASLRIPLLNAIRMLSHE
ncbi:MAG: hypothetical protein DHS20C06_04890 [Hyphobacterium sp.]|nr:MAG: hypothetical protein DHS20C06_04890 [Hyphobacterium sp.]